LIAHDSDKWRKAIRPALILIKLPARRARQGRTCANKRVPVELTHIGAAGANPPLEGEGREATERLRKVASGVG
jgi:hypothetical protein